jgi:hypothetical protein
MTKLNPILASASSIARLLDMKLGEFRGLVNAGLLPKGRKIGDYERWDVEEIRNIISGNAADGYGDVQW